MRERAEQMAELLDRASAKPARKRRRRGLAGVSSAVLGFSALAIGGTGIILGLDPDSANQELSLPRLHDLPGGATDDPAAGRDGASSADLPGVDATTGVAPLTEGAPRPAALPGTVTSGPRRETPARRADPGAGAPITIAPASPRATSAAPTTARTANPAPTTTRRPGAPAHPPTSPRSGRPSAHPTPRSTTTTSPRSAGLPHADSRASVPSVDAPSTTTRTTTPPTSTRRPGDPGRH